MDTKLLKICVGAGAIFSGGVGLGYLLGSHRQKEVIVYTPEPDVDEGEEKTDDQLQLDFELASVVENKDIEYIERETVVEKTTTTVKFDTSDDWNYEEEGKNRSPESPYILHYDEFIENELNFSQSTLTYFEGDNILCDEQDVPMYNHDEVVGELKFGHGSNDPNVVYIRNHHMKCEWEILYNPSSYEKEVLGLEAEKDLSDKGFKHGTPRFRME